jgi:hypothetical protein
MSCQTDNNEVAAIDDRCRGAPRRHVPMVMAFLLTQSPSQCCMWTPLLLNLGLFMHPHLYRPKAAAKAPLHSRAAMHSSLCPSTKRRAVHLQTATTATATTKMSFSFASTTIRSGRFALALWNLHAHGRPIGDERSTRWQSARQRPNPRPLVVLCHPRAPKRQAQLPSDHLQRYPTSPNPSPT